ncbi:MAG TPA: hypothetical protein VE251_02765, partial [Xanthobacteraceae bacterium]|nr:hypothetical protein [Xanthobacteraceae bacterium]
MKTNANARRTTAVGREFFRGSGGAVSTAAGCFSGYFLQLELPIRTRSSPRHDAAADATGTVQALHGRAVKENARRGHDKSLAKKPKRLDSRVAAALNSEEIDIQLLGLILFSHLLR